MNGVRIEIATPVDQQAQSLSPSQGIEKWEELRRTLTVLLRNEQLDPAWLADLGVAAQSLQSLVQLDPDMALYLQLQAAAHDTRHYGVQHSMLCATVCSLCSAWFDWSEDDGMVVVKAALTMNIAISAMQNDMARQTGRLSEIQRIAVANHASESSAMLQRAGVTDQLWLSVVQQHHDTTDGTGDLPLSRAQRLTQLLHRVDIYTAKLSRRVSRSATTPAMAARDACLDASGQPDLTGATILRALGFFPPGTFVLLASGDVGVVVRRSAKAHTPMVAAVRRGDGGTFVQPERRDTTISKFAVVRGMSAGEVNIQLDHERVLRSRPPSAGLAHVTSKPSSILPATS